MVLLCMHGCMWKVWMDTRMRGRGKVKFEILSPVYCIIFGFMFFTSIGDWDIWNVHGTRKAVLGILHGSFVSTAAAILR
jgi:hypothetical protein